MRQKVNDFILAADKEVKDGNFFSAIENYEKYLKRDPENSLILNRIGYLYGKLNESIYIDDQIEYFLRALRINPDETLTIRNLALAYQKAGKSEESVIYFQKLFKLGALPDDYFAYSCLKIQMGDFNEGWKYYEYRFQKEIGRPPYPRINKPLWEGQTLPNGTLLVQFEQGYGDSIQFFRYIKETKNKVGKLTFRVQDELVDLLKLKEEGIKIIGESTPVEKIDFDYHIPLMSLPRVLQASKENIPNSKRYLNADIDRIENYKNQFFNDDSIKVGISYNGAIGGNKRRNIPLKTFYPLSKLKNIRLYSFQKDLPAEYLNNLPKDIEIINLGETFNNFSDTAAAMANLDLFITCDNSLLNLAGAMGIKTYLLLNKFSEWRWFFDERRTPWYDSVKIFKKQYEHQSWDALMEEVIESIQKGF